MATRPSTSRTRWVIVVLAGLGTAINYLDRATLSVAEKLVREDLALGRDDMGLAMSAFFWTYAVFQLPSGWFVDKVGARVAYTVAAVWWSGFTMLTGLARGFGSLFTFRFLLGAGEAPAYPCNAKVVSQWFPKSERALATGIFDSGARAGSVVAIPLVTASVAYLGWRLSFALIGAVGLLWALGWWLYYRTPREHSRVSDEEIAHIEKGQIGVEPNPAAADADADATSLSWKDLFRYRTVWGMMLGFFCLNFVAYFFVTWFPTYLIEERGFDNLKLGFFGMIPGLFAMVTGWAGGLFSDTLLKRGYSLTKARKIPLVSGMLMSSCIALAVIVPEAWQAVALLSLSFGSITFAAASVWSLPADVAPHPKYVASIGGIQNFAANFAGIGISILVGYLYEATGTFLVPLLTTGAVAFVGAFSYLVVIREVAPLKTR